MQNKIIKAGTKIVFRAHPGFVGADHAEGYVLVHDYPESVIDDAAWQFGLEWAESYGVYPREEYITDLEEDEDEYGDQYSDGIEGWWEVYDAKKHDGRLIYGTHDQPYFREF